MINNEGPCDDAPKPAGPHEDESKAVGSQADGPGNWSDIGVFLVAFLDIPGQRDALSALQKLGRLPDPDVRVLDSLLRRTHLAVAAFRIIFSSLVPTFYKGLCTNQAGLFGEFAPPEPRFHFFADTCVSYVRMAERANDKPVLQLMVCEAFLAGLAAAFVQMLGEGHPLRGCVNLGWGWEIGGRELYGPVVSEAYELERTAAQYSRVIVSPALVSRLAAIVKAKPRVDYVDAESLATKVRELLYVDLDGHRALDYLGKRMVDLCTDTTKDSVRKAQGFLSDEAKLFEHERNTTQAIRTRLTQMYFFSRADLWSGKRE